MTLASDVSLTMPMVSLPMGGTITRIAWGRTMVSMARSLVIPIDCAASIWPRSTERMPLRTTSAV